MESFMKNAREVVNVTNQPVMLGARTGDANGISFLKTIRTDERCWNLTGNTDQRDGIHQRILQRRHSIGGTGTGCNQHDANLAG
ncbi:hypothetical protein D3C87_1931210 [compost metagenome]